MNVSNNIESDDVKVESKYFSVSTSKLVIMSICTLGLYEIYWFYKNWEHIKHQEQSNIMPFWRAFFAMIWAYSAFDYIRKNLGEEGLNTALYAGLAAIAFFVLNIMTRLPDPYWLVSFLSFLTLIPANNAITKINQKSDNNFIQNGSIKSWNWLAVALGGPFFALVAIEVFFFPQT